MKGLILIAAIGFGPDGCTEDAVFTKTSVSNGGMTSPPGAPVQDSGTATGGDVPLGGHR